MNPLTAKDELSRYVNLIFYDDGPPKGFLGAL